MSNPDARLIEGLKCGLDAVSYSYGTHCAVLHLPEGHCADMRGAIAYATHHWPGAHAIQTVSGSKPDVLYTRHGAEWEARRLTAGPRRRRGPQ